jgi:hypothetical protein
VYSIGHYHAIVSCLNKRCSQIAANTIVTEEKPRRDIRLVFLWRGPNAYELLAQVNADRLEEFNPLTTAKSPAHNFLLPAGVNGANKVLDGLVDVEDAMAAANRPHILEEYLKTKGGIAAQSTAGGASSPATANATGAGGGMSPATEKKSGFMSWGKK